MDLRQMRHIVALSKRLNFTKAADDLGISQSALSKSIQMIEEQSGICLFERSRGGVRATTIGRDIIVKATGVLAGARDLEQSLSAVANSDMGEIGFGMAPLPARALLPQVLLHTSKHHPHLNCRVIVRSADALLTALLSGEIELFFCAEHSISLEAPVSRQAVGQFPLAYLARADHPIFSGSTHDLSAYRVLTPGGLPANPLTAYAEKFLPHVDRYEVEDYGVLAKVAEQSDGIWITSPHAAREEIEQARLKEIPLEGAPASFRMLIYTAPNRTLSPAAKMIFQECKNELNRLGAGP